MHAKIYSSALLGIDAFRVSIEVNISKGLGVMITGLPDDGIRESYNRIFVAITANGYEMPRTKLVINLAPADIRKTGTAFDLPIAIAILLASAQIHDLDKLNDYTIVGELGLDGNLHPIRGTLSMACQAKADGFKGIIVPRANADEASIVEGIHVYPAASLEEILSFIQSDDALQPYSSPNYSYSRVNPLDFSQVKGQEPSKRALEIAAAGGHNALLIGPPGTSKTMLAKRLPTILPPMTKVEALETTRIHSVVSGLPIARMITERPFRSPHHTCSDIALIGGGSYPMPGEISLAHNGILFLDELGEFKRSVIEVLRQPMEDRKVLIARAKMSLEFPSSFTLIAAMNPCMCGYYTHPKRKCTCSKNALAWYRRKISGPLLERIDLQIEVEPVDIMDLMQTASKCESSADIRTRVIKARKIQSERFKMLHGIHCNSQIPDTDIQRFCELENPAKHFLYKQMEKFDLSARSYSRILKVARTIADLDNTAIIEIQHIAEAIHFRSLDKPILNNHNSKQQIH